MSELFCIITVLLASFLYIKIFLFQRGSQRNGGCTHGVSGEKPTYHLAPWENLKPVIYVSVKHESYIHVNTYFF